MMNGLLVQGIRVLISAFLLAWAGTGIVSAQQTHSDTLGVDTTRQSDASIGDLPWLRILVEGGRAAAEALSAMEMDLLITQNASGARSVVSGNIGFPIALMKGDGHAAMIADRYPMVLLVDREQIHFSRFDQDITTEIQLRRSTDEGSDQIEHEPNPKIWRTFELFSEAVATPVWVVLIERSQYCPLVDLANVPDCENFEVEDSKPDVALTEVTGRESGSEGFVRPVARSEAETSDLNQAELTGSETVTLPPPPPEPVDYEVTISLAFLGTLETTYGRLARNLNDDCAIQFMPVETTHVVEADIDFRAMPPIITATISALPDAPINLNHTMLRFEQGAETFRDCAYDGAVFALDEMSQDGTMIAGQVTLPAVKPRFQLIYDLSGQLIGEDERQSNAAVLGFAARVKDVLDSRLTYASSRYIALEEYFAWVPSTSIEPKIEPMSGLDQDDSAKPRGTQHLHELNDGVREQMLDRISESVGGVATSANR